MLDDILRLDNQLCFAIYACSKEIIRLYRPYLEPLNLTYTQYITLLALLEKDEVSVKELGDKLYLDSGTLTPLLKKLEEHGHITRTRSKDDERKVVIRLTEPGRSLNEKFKDIPNGICCDTGLSSDEISKLRDQVKYVLNSIKNN
ncbi:MarR family winged helix-turn-helix transcriptional regulator [Clostridium hydrogeniformans]|uniref:MarR family winged helix-turn-helix transcriptional regulator n=1 Tax=Clostridium hydrogeniformans TaxID=349933 RepID=UPI00048561F0|nr:MarR family transcriptional regulator [Clostridium hydrogeniformans]